MQPEIRYAKSGDVHIAYQVFGAGSLDLVYIPGFISNIETYWEWPEFAAWLHRMGTRARVIIFDKRGTGLSDRLGRPPNFDQRMDDARAVMDAAGSKRAAVMGLSEGGSLATLFAGTHPERCSALILYGAFAHFSDWFPTRQKFDAFISYVDTSWGSGTSFRIFRPVQERQRRLSALVGPMGKAGRQPVSGAEPDANEQRNQYRWHPALDPRAYIGPSPATRAANAGATVAQLEAIFGWQGGSMAALYTRAADRRRLSIEAMSKLENDKRTSIVAPLYEVRHLGEKGK